MTTCCETCIHYRPDPVNPAAGLGSCGHPKQHLARYPAQQHFCRDHEKKQNDDHRGDGHARKQ